MESACCSLTTPLPNASAGAIKIVVATNVAETSITIDDVTCVIDCGRAKEMRFDPDRGIARLQEAWVSQVSADIPLPSIWLPMSSLCLGCETVDVDNNAAGPALPRFLLFGHSRSFLFFSTYCPACVSVFPSLSTARSCHYGLAHYPSSSVLIAAPSPPLRLLCRPRRSSGVAVLGVCSQACATACSAGALGASCRETPLLRS